MFLHFRAVQPSAKSSFRTFPPLQKGPSCSHTSISSPPQPWKTSTRHYTFFCPGRFIKGGSHSRCLWCPASLTQHPVFKTHPHRGVLVLCSSVWLNTAVFHHVERPHFVSAFPSRWASGVLPCDDTAGSVAVKDSAWTSIRGSPGIVRSEERALGSSSDSSITGKTFGVFLWCLY